MIDTKKHERALEAGQRRKAELSKALEPLKKAHAKAEAEQDAIGRELMALRGRLAAFEALKADMTDDEYLAGRARVDLLAVKGKRAAEAAAATRKALGDAEEEARSEIRLLSGAALIAWRDELAAADAEYQKAWRVL